MCTCVRATWAPYANLVSNIESNSYHCLSINSFVEPNQAAQMVARTRHQVKLPLMVEFRIISNNKRRLVRLARAAAAAGANAILLTSDDFASVQTVLSEIYRAVTLPLLVRCPIVNKNEEQKLQALGAAQVTPL
ncbi:MAG: hypothetical protein ACOYEO_05660 [bacterium]|jgi:indole-3-glycerol phosphate synthase